VTCLASESSVAVAAVLCVRVGVARFLPLPLPPVNLAEVVGRCGVVAADAARDVLAELERLAPREACSGGIRRTVVRVRVRESKSGTSSLTTNKTIPRGKISVRWIACLRNINSPEHSAQHQNSTLQA
jgi:hypothetical protein